MLLVLAIGGPTTAAPRAATDTVRDWNLYAASALSNLPTALVMPGAGQTPPVTALHLAMVQGAVYDAVNGIEGGYQPYLAGLPTAPRNASPDAAAATAAHHVLVGLESGGVPLLAQPVRDWLDAAYATSLAGIPGGPAKVGGIAVGAAAADAMLRLRATDGRYGPFRFTPGMEAGQWRPELPPFLNDPFAWVARVHPFMLTSQDQFLTRGPDPLRSKPYLKDFKEVKELGSASSRTRTDEQTAIALFYTDHALALWNRGFRAIAEQERLTTAEEARLFAMLNLAAADALIGCWDDKAHWSFWRPINAIRHAETDPSPATEPDPDWTPLVPTPPYPYHSSGYNCVSSAIVHTAQDFFRTDKIHFTLHNIPRNEDRTYDRFSSALDDIIDARVWAGIHFRNADLQGFGLGKDVAHWLKNHYFRPVHGRH